MRDHERHGPGRSMNSRLARSVSSDVMTPLRLASDDRPLSTDDGLREVYAAHGPELFRFAHRSLGDRQLAEEAVQETFLRAWRNERRFDEALGSLRTWLFAITRNVVIDLARSRSARPAVPVAMVPEQAEGDSELERLATLWQLEEALRRLRPEHHEVLVEVSIRGRQYSDVATELGVPEGTVKSRVYYGLRALRVALEELGWEE